MQIFGKRFTNVVKGSAVFKNNAWPTGLTPEMENYLNSFIGVEVELRFLLDTSKPPGHLEIPIDCVVTNTSLIRVTLKPEGDQNEN